MANKNGFQIKLEDASNDENSLISSMHPSEGVNNLGLGLMRSKTRFDMKGSFHSRHKAK